MTINWKDLSVLDAEYITHEVNGELHKFWPITIGRLAKARKQFTSLGQAITVLLRDAEGDMGKHSVTEPNGRMELVTMPKTEALATHHHQIRKSAIDALSTGLLEPASLENLGLYCMEAMREDFPEFNENDAKGFVQNVPLPIFGEMLVGVVKANKGIFGSFTKRAVKIAEDRLKDLTNPLAEESEDEPTSKPSSDEPPSESAKLKAVPLQPPPTPSGTS